LTNKISTGKFEHIGFNNDSNPEEENGENTETKSGQDDLYKIPAKLAQKYVVVGEGHRISFLLSILMASQNSKVILEIEEK